MNSPLRTLAADYAAGKLDRIAYLQQRAELIDKWVKDTLPETVLPQVTSSPSFKWRDSIIKIIILIILVLLGIIIWLANNF